MAGGGSRRRFTKGPTWLPSSREDVPVDQPYDDKPSLLNPPHGGRQYFLLAPLFLSNCDAPGEVAANKDGRQGLCDVWCCLVLPAEGSSPPLP